MGRGRAPCCEKVGLNKGSWTPEEDMRLMAYIQKYGHGNWRALPKRAGVSSSPFLLIFNIDIVRNNKDASLIFG